VVTANILIQTEVARDILDSTGVQQAQDVTGPYDVIVRAEARTSDELGQLVVARAQGVGGITRTLTCPGRPPLGGGVGHLGDTDRRHPRVNSGQSRQARILADGRLRTILPRSQAGPWRCGWVRRSPRDVDVDGVDRRSRWCPAAGASAALAATIRSPRSQNRREGAGRRSLGPPACAKIAPGEVSFPRDHWVFSGPEREPV
jgi:Lrp/AsnC ligand binding domain